MTLNDPFPVDHLVLVQQPIQLLVGKLWAMEVNETAGI